MAKSKDRASPTKTVKSAGAKTPGSRPTRAASPVRSAPDAPSQEVVSPARGGGNSGTSPTPEQLYRMIQETAYFKAKARNFAPGHEVQDWIEAEAEFRRVLDSRA
jgi:hypothetical protein